MGTVALRRALASLRRRLEALYGQRLSRLVLFGSRGRGSASRESDVDVLVVLEGDVAPGLEIARCSAIVGELSLEYDVVLSCAYVAADRYRDGKSPFLLNVRREGVAV